VLQRRLRGLDVRRRHLPAARLDVHRALECCVGLTCNGNTCGTPPVDAGSCTLDPGGTPCSQCIVGSCCDETQNCLFEPECATNLACFQRCAISGTDPGTCEMMCCTGPTCTIFADCITVNCASLCF
jgi:hypothetical protein